MLQYQNVCHQSCVVEVITTEGQVVSGVKDDITDSERAIPIKRECMYCNYMA